MLGATKPHKYPEIFLKFFPGNFEIAELDI